MQFGRTFLRDDSLPNRDPEDLPDGYWLGLRYKYDYIVGDYFVTENCFNTHFLTQKIL